jgi:hypothetical protein
MSEVSPEKSAPSSAKGTPQHRRMQSLQPGTVRDLSYMIEGRRDSVATPRSSSPEKQNAATTPTSNRDPFVDGKSDERGGKALILSPKPGPSLTPIVRPTVRRPHQSILGENTPPQSATMLALQNMATPTPREAEAPLSNVTNVSNSVIRAPQSLDSLSGQILVLTNIATALQKEMAQLSRRSRDNATDLMSLKEATHTRDEDIRKSLRDLVHHQGNSRPATRDQYLLEGKPASSSPQSLTKSARPFSLPRIPSPNSFAASIDRDNLSTPSLFGADSSATMALLEKIVHDMGTKEGQDTLLSRLSDLASKLNGMASSSKVEELIQLLRAEENQSLVLPRAGGPGRPRDFSFDVDSNSRALEYGAAPMGGPMTARVGRLLAANNEVRRSSAPQTGSHEIINEDFLNIIRTVKDSVAQGGGLTAEVKALVRELRGEVLGMGREIGRRLDAAELGKRSAPSRSDALISTRAVGNKDEVSRVVEEGLDELKQHMNNLLREHRRQSATSTSSKASAVDYQEVYNALRAALKDSQALKGSVSGLSKDDVVAAVQDAWERYKPEADAQQFALDRDEILSCLKEGLAHYGPLAQVGATREEVFSAVVEGLKHFSPPQMESPTSLSRDEILDAVRECLEDFEFPVTKDAMVDAVKEGLAMGNPHHIPMSASGEAEFAARLQDIMELIRAEFQAISKNSGHSTAVYGDTKQVLDATNDGFDKLRVDIEGYIDQVSGAAAQEDFMDGLTRTLDSFSAEIASLLSKNPNALIAAKNISSGGNNHDILRALEEGISTIRAEISNRPVTGHSEMLGALHEGLGDIRTSIDKLRDKPTDLTATDEILEALKTGLDGLRSEMDAMKSVTGSSSGVIKNDKALTTVTASAKNDAVVPTDVLKHDDIKNLEVLIASLRIKVEAMEAPASANLSKDDLSGMEDMLRNVQESVAGISGKQSAGGGITGDNASREDVQAIETILRNTKSRLDDLIDGEQAVRKDHIDALETMILETRENLNSMAKELDSISRKEDVGLMETVIAQLVTGIDELKERHEKALEDPERVIKTDIDAIEAVCLEVKSAVDQLAKNDIGSLSTKEDLAEVRSVLDGLKERLTEHVETTEKLAEDRQAEAVGIAAHVSDVKKDLSSFQELVKDKLEDSVSGIASLSELVTAISEALGPDANIRQDLKDMFETMKNEFELSKAGVVGAKLESDEKFQQTTDTLQTKIDERIDELLCKCDEVKITMDAKTKAGEAREQNVEAAVSGTKNIAEDLKVMIDTLGSTVTESLEKMEEASKTVFIRVDEMVNKADENHSDTKAEHAMTRDTVKQAIGVAEGIQGHVVEYQPKILEAVKDVLLIVGQHYEHSKSGISTLQEKIEAAEHKEEPPMLPPVEKYDDSEVHVKLDRLVDHTGTAEKAFGKLDTLETMHAELMKVAGDLTAFMATQTQRIQDEHEDKERSLQDAAIALERKLAQSEQAEVALTQLRDEEDTVRASVLKLKVEQESLIRQKTRLTGDVSSLETALHLRREELHEMEARVEALERRIVEGVMDHSRIMLINKTSKTGNSRDIMSRKRVPSSKSVARGDATRNPSTTTSVAPIQMALAPNRNTNLRQPQQQQAARRILSLSQITGNATNAGFKRSQSVRHPGASGLRKSSWGGVGSGQSTPKRYGDLARDKENVSLVRESDEDGSEGEADAFEDASDYAPRQSHGLVLAAPGESLVDEEGGAGDGNGSGADTPRRSSRGTTVVTGITDSETDSQSGLGRVSGSEFTEDGETGSEWTESQVGSSVTGSELVLHEG